MKGSYYWIPQAVRNEVSKRSGGICHYCKEKAAIAKISKRGVLQFLSSEGRIFHIDHVIPLAHGGVSEIDNLVLACQECNLSRRKKKILNDPVVQQLLHAING